MDSDGRKQNGFLAALDADDFEALRPHLRTVALTQSQRLVKIGDTINDVYLLHSGVISLVVELDEGERVEVAMIGRDSVLNLSGVLGVPTAVTNAVVIFSGVASVLDVGRLRAAAEGRPALRALLARHGMALFVQAQQTAGCNAAHSVENRLARWLLRVRDLTGSDTFKLTQELMAQMIGARRNSVSIVANTLQRSHYIRYSRGHIEITDFDGLNGSVCECYGAVKHRCEGLFQLAARHRRIAGRDTPRPQSRVSATRRILKMGFLDSSNSSICHSVFCLRLREMLLTRSPQTLVISAHAAFWSASSIP